MTIKIAPFIYGLRIVAKTHLKSAGCVDINHPRSSVMASLKLVTTPEDTRSQTIKLDQGLLLRTFYRAKFRF